MGSWTELDARYAPGSLTPASAFVAALGHFIGANTVYVHASTSMLADWLPRHGIAYDHDVLIRAERYLTEVELEQFLSEACTLLHPEQKLCLALNVLDRALSRGARPAEQPRFTQIIEGLGLSLEQLQPYWWALAIKNELSIFPQ